MSAAVFVRPALSAAAALSSITLVRAERVGVDRQRGIGAQQVEIGFGGGQLDVTVSGLRGEILCFGHAARRQAVQTKYRRCSNTAPRRH